MSKFHRLIAVAAVAVLPLAAIGTASAADNPYAPYAPQATPTPRPTPTPGPVVTPADQIPTVVLNNVESAVAKAFNTLKFGRVLGQGHSTVTIPIAGVGTYTVTFLYREPGKKFKSIAKGAIIVKTAGGKTTNLAIKPNANGKSVYKKLKKAKKKTIKVQVQISYETGGKTLSTTINKTFKR